MDSEFKVIPRVLESTPTAQMSKTIEERYYEVLYSNKPFGYFRGCGSFQFFTSLAVLLSLWTYGWMLYGQSYYELFPVLNCEHQTGTEICTPA